jgi:hypothetical protein
MDTHRPKTHSTAPGQLGSAFGHHLSSYRSRMLAGDVDTAGGVAFSTAPCCSMTAPLKIWDLKFEI